MKLLYLANIRFPTEKAHGIQIMKMCEAFVHTGAEVQLLVSNRRTTITENAFTYYGIKTRFPVFLLNVFDTVNFGKLGFIFESICFALQSLRYLHKCKPDVIFCRDEIVLWCISFFTNTPMVWESHDGRWNNFAYRISRKIKTIIVTSEGQKKQYLAKGFNKNKLLVAANGITLEDFSTKITQESAREKLNLPKDKKIVMYIGRLDGWKGVSTLLEASKSLSKNILVVIIGGEPEQIRNLKSKYSHVLFLGFIPYRNLGNNQAAADILVLPNTSHNEISAEFTSPLKLFTYMASGRPIVASDLPSIREIVDEKTVYFFEADDAESLSSTIQVALSDKFATQKAELALEEVKKYTWDARASKIMLNLYGK